MFFQDGFCYQTTIARQPRFLTKEQRAQLAIQKRAQEIKDQREREDRAKQDREALEREAEEIRARERERERSSRYGSGGGGRSECFVYICHLFCLPGMHRR